MERWRKAIEESPLFVGFLLALFGGLVNGMLNIKIKEISPRELLYAIYQFIVQVAAAGLVGAIAGMIMMFTAWHPIAEGAIIAICGSCATVLLKRLPDIMIEWVRKMLGLSNR
jgi:hypothetical protein